MVTPSLEVDPACGCAPRARGRTVSGGHGDGVTPVPISNTAVKPISADGTWGVAPWESRTPPGFLRQKPLAMRGAFVALGVDSSGAVCRLFALRCGVVFSR